MMVKNRMNIAIVLVTFNRLEKLKIALKKYQEQTYLPKHLIVVDNCSTDGTREFLEQWEKIEDKYEKHVLRLSTNTGGAGGFYEGMRYAVENLQTDWIWVSDDDAYPRADALKVLSDYYSGLSIEEQNKIVSLCAAIYNAGKIHAAHCHHLKVTRFKVKLYSSVDEEYQQKAFPIDIFSYVGTMIKTDALKKAGLDRKEFFIYCDDQEHAIRLGRYGKIICVPNSIVDHDTPPHNPNVVDWGWYYKKRNDLLMIKYNFPKRYFILRYMRRYLSDISVFSSNPAVLKKMFREAYRDAKNNHTGIHSLYKPGWAPQDEQDII